MGNHMIRNVDNEGRGRAGRRRKAFTLVELLIAVALLVILGGMLLGTLRYGTDLWRAGNTRSYCYDTATVVFDQLGKDIGASLNQFWNKDADAYDGRIGFLVDYDSPPAPAPRPPEQRLRFVSKIPDNTVNPTIRRAGNGSDDDVPPNVAIDEDYYSLNPKYPPLPPAGNGTGKSIDLQPLEGMCELAYMLGTGATDSKTLYRAVLAPIGDPTNSLFVNALADPSLVGTPLTEDVMLYFELRLWSKYTTTWDSAVPCTAWANSFTPGYCGPLSTWNSQGDTADDPLDPSTYRDNIFPRAVMAVVVVQPPESLRGPARLTLASPISQNQLTIPVSGALPPYSTAWPYIRIDNEWIRFTRFDATTQTFVLDPADPLAERGARNPMKSPAAQPANHSKGAEVSIGLTFSTVFYNPAGKEFWGVTP